MAHNKKIGMWLVTALVAGNMIGSGIFLLPSTLAQFGSISMFAWLFTAVGAILLALVFARLSQVMPKVGGAYAYCREAYGEFIGFMVAYNYWFAVCVGNAATTIGFVGYLSFFFPILRQHPLFSFLCAIGMLWFLTWVNIMGVRQAGQVQLWSTLLKILPLLVIIIMGASYVSTSHFIAFNVSPYSNGVAFSSAAAITLWAFIGLESATVPAEEVLEPQKTIPRATIFGTVAVAIIYMASTAVIMCLIPQPQLVDSTAPYADAAVVLLGHWGAVFVALGAVISCFGGLNGWILLQGRIPMAAARDQLLPSFFAKCNKNGVPQNGFILSSLVVTILLAMNYHRSLVEQYTLIIQLAVMATLVPYFFTSLAECVLMVKKPSLFAKKRGRLPVLIAILAFAYTYWAIMGVGVEIIYYGCLLLFSSLPVYVWMQWNHKQ